MASLKYWHGSKIGAFFIELRSDSRWHVLCDDEDLGNYHSETTALAVLCRGATDWPGVTDPSTLGLPDNLGEWHASTSLPG